MGDEPSMNHAQRQATADVGLTLTAEDRPSSLKITGSFSVDDVDLMKRYVLHTNRKLGVTAA